MKIASLPMMTVRETHANLDKYACLIILEMESAIQQSARIILWLYEDPKSLVLLHALENIFLRTIIINLINLQKFQEE